MFSRQEWHREPSAWARSLWDGGLCHFPSLGLAEVGAATPQGLRAGDRWIPNPPWVPRGGFSPYFMVEGQLCKDSQGFAFCCLSMSELTEGRGKSPRNTRQRKACRESEK